jgi:hypothetical protein
MSKKDVIIGFAVLFGISYGYNKVYKHRDIIKDSAEIAATAWDEGYNEAESTGAVSEAAGQPVETAQETNTGLSDEEYLSMPITVRNYLDEYIQRNGIPVKTFSQRSKFNERLQDAVSKIDQYSLPLYNYLGYSGILNEYEILQYGQEAFASPDTAGLPIEKYAGSYCVGNADRWDDCDYVFYGDVKSTASLDKLTGSGVIIEQKNMYHVPLWRIVYIGELKDGVYSGYGQQYYAPDEYNRFEEYLMALNGEDTVNLQKGMLTYCNYLEYEGEFEKGKYSGNGNCYEYMSSSNRAFIAYITGPDVDEEMKKSLAEDCDQDKLQKYIDMSREVAVYTGTFKKGNAKKIKCYVLGQSVDPEDDNAIDKVAEDYFSGDVSGFLG